MHTLVLIALILITAGCAAPTPSPSPVPNPTSDATATMRPVASAQASLPAGLSRDRAIALAREAAPWVPATATVQVNTGTFRDLALRTARPTCPRHLPMKGRCGGSTS